MPALLCLIGLGIIGFLVAKNVAGAVVIGILFMIGSEDLSIDAICNDGKTVPIFRDGNWAF